MRSPHALLPCLAFFAGTVLHAAPTAAENFTKHCAGCHGENGKAQTRLGRKSGAKDLTAKARMRTFSDADLFAAIKHGRKDAGGEEKMEPFAKQLSDPEITALVTLVRRFSQ